MQKEITERQPLLGKDGNIVNPGYAKKLLWDYNRENIVAPKARIKGVGLLLHRLRRARALPHRRGHGLCGRALHLGDGFRHAFAVHQQLHLPLPDGQAQHAPHHGVRRRPLAQRQDGDDLHLRRQDATARRVTSTASSTMRTRRATTSPSTSPSPISRRRAWSSPPPSTSPAISTITKR